MDKIVTDAGELSIAIEKAVNKIVSDELVSRSLKSSLCNEVLLYYSLSRTKERYNQYNLHVKKWIEEQDLIICPECGSRFKSEIIYLAEMNNCPKCGAKLV